jgi:phenylacetate-CoA ligase
MLIRSRIALEALQEARREIARHRRGVPADEFYDRKLALVWDRAKQAPAYAGLGAFGRPSLQRLVPTSREALKSDPSRYSAVELGQGAKYYETSGTSGRVTPTPRLRLDIIWNTVSVAEAWGDLLRDDSRVLILLPSDVVPVGDLIASACEYLDLCHLRAYPFATGACDWGRLIGAWHTFEPTTVFCAPGVALQLTRLLEQRGLLGELAKPIRELMLLGEVSTPAFRDRLGSWWRSDVFDASYGSTETGTLAAGCRVGNQHLLVAANYFELALPDGVVALDQSSEGTLIVTPLNAHARPLLRFDTGDLVSISDSCPCGNRAPVVAVQGRQAEQLTVDGVELSPRSVEELVFETTNATGYLIEVDEQSQAARLVLERGIGWQEVDEDALKRHVAIESERRLALHWQDVVVVNALPIITKSGASQKNWKRSNVRQRQLTP